jgi:hypothetical protein
MTPKALYCLVAENFRPDLSGFATVIGFIGIMPHVRISVKDVRVPMPSLAFALTFERGDGSKFDGYAKLIGPRNSNLFDSKAEVSFPNIGAFNTVIFNLANVSFPDFGEYKFSLELNGKPIFEGSMFLDPMT